jgi:hypothetical protein
LETKTNIAHKIAKPEDKILKQKTAIAVSTGLLIIALLFAFVGANLLTNETTSKPQVFLGVDVAFGDEDTVYTIANAVSGYANLIVLGSLTVTNDTEVLTRVCDYLYQKDFYFIIYVGFATEGYLPPRGPDQQFFNNTINRWDNKFLGAYFFDEAGGKQIDQNHPVVFRADNYTQAAKNYVYDINNYLVHYATYYYDAPQMKLFTSDYALYWYDYLSSYDVVFGEFVGNQSRQITVALNRGAAHTLDKEWGIIITYPCQDGNCTETAPELYNDMITAWNSGATYIVAFDGNSTAPNGVLTTDHFNAIKQFGEYTKTNPRTEKYPADTAYVLPQDYGYGLRGPSDKIWGLWNADTLAPKIWNDVNNLLATYDNKIDIVYEKRIDGQPVTLPYKTLIFWNGTTTQNNQTSVSELR